jgi:CheY-like chemotaxis protein
MSDPSTWNVLVVDDEPDNIGVVEYILLFHNAKVRIANTGFACMEILRQERPTLLLLDIQMPVMSGWDVLKEIRNDEKLRDLTVIALTAHAMSGDHEKALAAGFDGYISKPISPLSFVDDVKAIVMSRSKP